MDIIWSCGILNMTLSTANIKFKIWYHFYTPPHDSGGILWFHVGRPCVYPSGHPSIHPSVVRPSVFRFRMIIWININRFSTNLVCVLISWRSGLGLLMGKFHQILMELSARDTSIFSFPDNNLSKCQGILTKLGTCMIWRRSGLGLLIGKFPHCLTELSAHDTILAGYYSLTFLFIPNIHTDSPKRV